MKNKIIIFLSTSLIVPILLIIVMLGVIVGSSSDKKINEDGTVSDERYFEKIKWATLDETGEYSYTAYSNQEEDRIDEFKPYNMISFDLKKEDFINATLNGLTMDTKSNESRTIYYRTLVFEKGYNLDAFITYFNLSEEEKSSLNKEDIPTLPIYMSSWLDFNVSSEIESVSIDASVTEIPNEDITVIVYFNDIPDFISYHYDEELDKEVPSNIIENQFGFDELYLFMFEREVD